MPKITKKSAKKVVRKPAAKKSTRKAAAKKAAKRAYTRKPKTVDVKVEATEPSSFAGEPSPEVEDDIKSFGEALHQAFENIMNSTNNGQFSASGMLDLGVCDCVSSACSNVVFSVRKLVEASIGLEKSANGTPSERDVATARQRLAVAEFELAMDDLESAIRG